ncbi:MAG: hypothetical protein GAK31_01664 [Stenotrophomonas maltophilia]|uniref:Phage tail tape measure protein n=1 Tax=Stenotrophomonas maltophilia TaxID=40324 RepID=A0A7V8FHY3_STEMA|nr:MAG: hypothetical protein GAK31_01664 [Stenotrophomonas maltophilia]
MDIAELGYKVDSSGLVEGTKALEENAAAADKADTAAELLEKSQKDTGKSASFWANEQAKINARVQEMEQIEQRAARATQQAARASEARELNLQKLLGQINPTVAALNSLAEQEDKLARARDLGLLKPQVWQQYQNQLDGTRAGILATSNSFGKLNLQTIEAQQSVAVLFRALATGNFAQVQSSITSLVARTGALGGAFTLTGMAVGGAVAGIGALVAIAATGYMELRRLEAQVSATGTAAGFTASQLLAMRSQLGEAKGNYKDAGAAIGQLVDQGRASGQMLELVASAALNISELTGRSISSTVNEVETLATGGADALVKLNDRYNFLTLDVYRHIEAIRQQRGDYIANEEAAKQLDDVIRQRAQSMADSAGVVERAWKGALAAFKGTLEEVKQLGSGDFDSQIERARKDLLVMQTLQNSPIPGDASRGRTGEQQLKERIALLQQWKQELGDGASILGQVRQYDRDAISAERDMKREREAADEALKGRLAGLDREASKLLARNKIIELYNKLDDNDARHFDGSMQRLLAKSNADIDKQFNRQDGIGKKNADDNSAKTLLATTQRQIEANVQLADTGIKVGESERLAAKIKQELDDKTNTMTASTRALLVAERERLLATDAQATKAQQTRRDLAAQAALLERLAQLENQRRQQGQIDLMSLGHGADATQMLQRQLDIQRQYLDEQEKLDKAQRNKNTALSQAEYQQETADIQAAKDRALQIERSYQDQRMAILGDWRAGVTRAWEDYAFAARNAMDQASGVMQTALTGWEDMWVRFAETGKLSFSDLTRSVIADLIRIQARQAAVNLLGGFMGGFGGGGGIGGVVKETIPLLGFGGGRARGGGVDGSSFYEVGEGGRPELFRQNGKTYLIPGNNGQVVPAAPTAGGGAGAAGPSQLSVTVHIDGDGNTTAQASEPTLQQFGQDIGRMIEVKYRELQQRDLRPDGVLGRMRR